MTGKTLVRFLRSKPVLGTWLAWHDREWLVRPLADLLHRSWDVEVHEMTAEEVGACRSHGIHCEASFCCRPCTHAVHFDFHQGRTARRRLVRGETFFCAKAARRYARHRGVPILPPVAPEGDSRDA